MHDRFVGMARYKVSIKLESEQDAARVQHVFDVIAQKLSIEGTQPFIEVAEVSLKGRPPTRRLAYLEQVERDREYTTEELAQLWGVHRSHAHKMAVKLRDEGKLARRFQRVVAVWSRTS